MSLSDNKLTEALEAFCKRLVEGSEADPTGGTWDELTPGAQHHLKERYLGPLFAAAQVLAKPEVVESAEELNALPVGSVVLDDSQDVLRKYCHGHEAEGHKCHLYWDSLDEYGESFVVLPATVLHVGGGQ
jgi:hypothetical protein